MKIDRLILKDIWGPWVFGVGLFSSLLMAATYLGRLAGFIVDGVPPMLVLQLVGLYLPAMLVKTFSMSVLLACLLGFGRLSSDSEIVALRAAGASIYRIVAPVVVFSALIALATFEFNEQIVPIATFKSEALTKQLMRSTSIHINEPVARTVIENQKLKFAVMAKNVNPGTQSLQGVVIAAYDKDENLNFLLVADEAEYKNQKDWSVQGHVRMISADFRTIVDVDEASPMRHPELGQSFGELTADRDDNFDSMTMVQIRDALAFHRAKKDKKISTLHNYEYGYWTKIAVPLAAIAFGVLGAVLGIRNHRTGTAAGFALAVAIIFGYVTLANFMSVWAIGGIIPAWAAAFAPLVIGGVVSGVIMWRRNG